MGDKSKKERAQPFLRWAGSKRQLLPRLTLFWTDDYERYIEPFMGSACLFFALQPRKALLGDLNAELVTTFIQVRDNPQKVWHYLRAFPRNKESYYRLRSSHREELLPAKVAARFIYLNRYCFNGLYRTNMSGEFNVPYAPSGTGSLPSRKMLTASSERLKAAEIRACDFAEIVTEVRSGDFVYLDPPFAVKKRRVFREYNPNAFDHKDLQRLGDILSYIDSRGATFVASYADCHEARATFAGWRIHRIRTRRNIAGFANKRKYAYELISTNADPG